MASFTGISIALQSILTQQQSLDIINHNVANANTTGYHRQEAVLTAGPTQGTPGFVNSSVISQIGTGVVLTDIKRYNDTFTDIRYRAENAASARWTIENNVLTQIESIEDETSEDGMSTKLDEFWASWKDVSDDPEDISLRSALLESGKQLCSAFNTRYASLIQVQEDLDNTIIQNVDEINALGEKVAKLNEEISRYATSSTQKNDFLDQQESYLDRLSALAGAKITYEANGQVMVSIGGHMLVQGTVNLELTTKVNSSNSNMVDAVWADGQPFNPTSGEMMGIFNIRDNVIEAEKTKLNNLAATIFSSVNSIHRKGYGLNDEVPSATYTSGSVGAGYPSYPYSSGSANPIGRDFFVVEGDSGYESGWDASGSPTFVDSSGSPTGYTYAYPSMINLALTISINTDLENVQNIAVAEDPQVAGDGRLAESLFLLESNSVKLKQVNTGYPGNGGQALIDLTDTGGTAISENINDYNSQRVTEMSLTIQNSDTLATQHQTLLTTLKTDRESVSGVSLDEEAANLLTYQRSYQASIRMMTAVDEMLDRVINGMGRVGL